MAIKNKEKNKLFELNEREENKHIFDSEVDEISLNEIDTIIDFLFEFSFGENSRSREQIYENFRIRKEINKDKNRLRSQGFFIF